VSLAFYRSSELVIGTESLLFTMWSLWKDKVPPISNAEAESVQRFSDLESRKSKVHAKQKRGGDFSL